MSKALARVEGNTAMTAKRAEAMETVVIQNDLSKLSPEQRVEYYRQFCESQRLPWTLRPFEYLALNGGLKLYFTAAGAALLRARDGISITIVSREAHGDVFEVTARATNAEGRSDESLGAVSIAGLRGESLANAVMKAETKAKRRVTQSICGMSMPDESELESIPNAVRYKEDPETGELIPVGNAPQPRQATPPPPARKPPQAATPDAQSEFRTQLAEYKRGMVKTLGQARADELWKGAIMPLLAGWTSEPEEKWGLIAREIERVISVAQTESRVDRTEPGAEG